MKPLALIISLAVLWLPMAFAGDSDAAAEIDYLLNSIVSSDCTFVRNGKRHDATAAESHLRMKYKRGKRYVSTAESFIERLATRSSMSSKLYYIECPGSEPVPSGEWLMSRLEERRR
jgi:outer membrane lipoprotein-sorting protein